jgi:hypothetical protein
VGVEFEHAVMARHDFAKCSWTVLSANMKTKKQNRSKGKVVKGGARNICQAPFSVKPGDLIGILDDRDFADSSAVMSGGASDSSTSVASEYLMTTSFDTAADFEGREAVRCADLDKRKQNSTSSVQKKRSTETALNIGSYHWDESDGEESD